MGFFQDLFGFKKKPKEEDFGKIKPYESLTQDAVGSELNKAILAGLGGKDIGFGEDFVSRTTNPGIAQYEADLPRQLRQAQATQSAMGMGRSTAGQRVIGDVQAQHGRDINQLISQAYLMNEQQKKADTARYQNLADTFTNQEAATRASAAGFDANRADALRGERNAWETSQSQATAKTIALPLAIAASVATGNPSFALGAFGANSNSSSDLDKLLKDIDRAEKVTAFTKSGSGNFGIDATRSSYILG